MARRKLLFVLAGLLAGRGEPGAGRPDPGRGRRQFHRAGERDRRRLQGQDRRRGGAELRRLGPVLRADPAGRAVPGVPVGRRRRPKAAVDAGLAVADSRFTYAIGKLVLWSKSLDVTKGDEALKANAFAKLSIANPKAAPYGAAAIEAMTKLGVYDAIQPKIVQGDSIAQAFEFVDTGNADSASSLCRNWRASRRDRAGSCRRRSTRRSARTRCC